MAQMMSVGLSREASTYMYCLLNFCVQISQTIIHLNGLCQRIKNPLTQHLLWNKLCCRLWCDGKKLSGSCLFSNGCLQEGGRLWFSSLGVRLHCVTQTAMTVLAEYVLVPLHFFFFHSAELCFRQTSPAPLLLLYDLLRNDRVYGAGCEVICSLVSCNWHSTVI